MPPRNKLTELNLGYIQAAKPRAMKALRLRRKGLTFQEIGAILGVTKQRALQLTVAARRYRTLTTKGLIT